MAVLAPCYFAVLPVEILEHIITLLDDDSPPPSAQLLHEPPTAGVFRRKQYPSGQKYSSLKDLSETCWRLRYMVAPRLLSYLKVDEKLIQSFVDFYVSRGQHAPPQSVLLYLDPTEFPPLELNDSDIDHLRFIRTEATRMVDIINPRALTIAANPNCLGWLIDRPLRMNDCWVTDVPYQMLRLEQGPLAPAQWFPHATKGKHLNLSTVRPWNRCTYNEGSFVPAYQTYEYHLYQAPSLHQSASLPELESHALRLSCLQSFELVAVFPVNHMTNTVHFLDLLPNLQNLSVQLAPSPKYQKTHHIGSSASCPSDFWQELGSSYDTLRNALCHNLAYLTTYTILDYASPGYRKIIDQAMENMPEDWKANHSGTWTRKIKT